jgi:hypothetical protein
MFHYKWHLAFICRNLKRFEFELGLMTWIRINASKLTPGVSQLTTLKKSLPEIMEWAGVKMEARSNYQCTFMWLLPLNDCSIALCKIWGSFTSWHNLSDLATWSDAQDMTNPHRAASHQEEQHPRVPSNTSWAMTHGTHCEYWPMTAVSPTCMSWVHIIPEWEMVWCSGVQVWLSLQISSRPS